MRDAFMRLRDKGWARHEGLGTIELSIGINTGTCLLGNMGSDKRVEYTAVGGAVNTAFRLCAEAAPGEIRIGSRTIALVHEDVRVESLVEGATSYEIGARRVLGLKYLT
jgi:adenylate cyclase